MYFTVGKLKKGKGDTEIIIITEESASISSAGEVGFCAVGLEEGAGIQMSEQGLLYGIDCPSKWTHEADLRSIIKPETGTNCCSKRPVLK